MFVNYFSKISINLVYLPLSFSVSSGQSLVFDWSLEDLENPAADEVLKNGLFPTEGTKVFHPSMFARRFFFCLHLSMVS